MIGACLNFLLPIVHSSRISGCSSVYLNNCIESSCEYRDILVAVWKEFDEFTVRFKSPTELVEKHVRFPYTSLLLSQLPTVRHFLDHVNDPLDRGFEVLQVHLFILWALLIEGKPFLLEFRRLGTNDIGCRVPEHVSESKYGVGIEFLVSTSNYPSP